MSVEGSTFDELRSVRMKDKDGVTERADLFLPTLDEYISICKKYDKQSILELKNAMPAHKVWEIAQRVQELGWFERTTFISFFGENLVALREKFPTASAQYLTDECTEEEMQFMLDNRLDADLCGYCVTPERVARLHEAGLVVNVWTLDTVEQAEQAKAAGVDMITSNILE